MKIRTYKRAWQGTMIAVMLLATLFAFKTEKKYSVELSKEQWAGVLQVIDQSNAGHSDVKTVQGWIVVQLQKQLADSTNKK